MSDFMFPASRCYGKRYAMAGLVVAALLEGRTVAVITTDPAEALRIVKERLIGFGDSEPETVLCGLTVFDPAVIGDVRRTDASARRPSGSR